MGRSVSIFLMRGASIFAAGMLLFAVFGHAHAENLDGYGLAPLPGGPVATGPAATNNSYNAAPVSGSYYPPASSYAVPPASTGYAPAPANPGYAPAPGGYNAGPPQLVAAAPQPTYQPPQAQSPVQQPGAYGYRAGDGLPPTAVAPAYPALPTGNGYYQTLNYQGGGQPSYPSSTGYNPDYVLGVGEKLKLTVFDETDLSGDYAIDGSGFVRLPLIGQVRAAGLTASQLEAAIGSALARGYLKSPRVSVAVTTYRPFYIMGAVNRPGEYPYVDHMNALNAVALAGGFQTNAVESVVFVRRAGSNEEVELPTDRSTAINPGDVVNVHTTFFSDAMILFSPLTGVAGTAALATTIH